MAAGNHTLGTIRGSIEIDYDGAGIVRAVKDVDRMKTAGEKADGATNKILGSFAKFAKGAAAVSGALGVVSNGLGIVAGALAVVGPLAAAGFAAAPGVILAYVSVLTIAKVAIAGVGDAMAEAGEGGAKFEEAMKKLSPEAQKFVKAYQKVIPVLNEVKQSIQDAFFQGQVQSVKNVANAVEDLGPAATGVSGELGKLVANTVRVATSSKNVERLREVLLGVQAFLARIRSSIGPVVTGFLKLGAQAAAFGGVVGGKVDGALAKLAVWLASIDLAGLFEKAAPIVAQLAAFFKDLMVIATQLFGVFATDGANAAGILAELASKLAEFLQSAEGQAALTALGQAMQAIAGAGGQIFLALLQALAPALVALAPGITTLATQIAGVLVPAINALAPVLSELAGFLSENMSWLGPLAGAVLAVAAAYKVYLVAAKAVAAVQAIIASRFIAATAAWIANTAAVVANGIATAATATINSVRLVASVVASTAAIVAQRVALVAGAVAMGVVRVAVIAWTAVQWLLNAALAANPIGLIVIAIAALVAGLIYAYRNSETFRNVVQAVWAAIKVAIGAVVDWITGTIWPSLKEAWAQIAAGAQTLWGWIKTAWRGIYLVISTYLNIIKTITKAVWTAIATVVRTYINIVRTVITTVINAVKAVWTAWLNTTRSITRAVWTAIVSFITAQIAKVRTVIARIVAIVAIVRNAFNQANSAVKDRLNAIVSLVRGLAGRVSNALGNVGSLLYSKGQALIRGFINGIGSMIGAVKAKAQSVVSAVTRFLPGSPAKEGPLSGRGYVLLRARRFMDDFARGLDDGAQGPRAAMLGAVSPLARATVSGGSGTGSGASTAPATPLIGLGNRTYTIKLGEREIADLVVDVVTGNPVAVSKASNEGSRRTAWAGSGR